MAELEKKLEKSPKKKQRLDKNNKMAIGFSGSNSGIGNIKTINNSNRNLEVSYFINNSCNLNCKHCYVGYNEKSGDLSIQQWKETFNDLINLGATTFGNVGKEPLLSWDKTKEILIFLKEKRKTNSKIRFGIVTNLTLLTPKIAKDLNNIMPNYIDVSLDGYNKDHDYIRGKGNFKKTFNNLKLISETYPDLSQKIFISFVLMQHNKEDFKKLLEELSKIKIKKILISPYVEALSDKKIYAKDLALEENKIIEFYTKIIKGNLLKNLNNTEIILKNDFDTLKHIMDKCIKKNLINLDNLYTDEYGVIFNQYNKGSNKIIINYLPKNNLFSKEIRISHDGYISNCYAQFFENYPIQQQVIGNIREKPIKEILKPYLN